MHVLIAEDDRVTGEILARTLQRWNYSTTLVTNGGDDSATFLVLQGIGEYDYVPLV